jgi:acyl CoA:acetate/3-ketoacid CoA transferase beta subunit
VITDLGVLEPDPVTCELVMTSLHPGVTRDQIRAATGWDVRFAVDLSVTAPPTELELATLRGLGRD